MPIAILLAHGAWEASEFGGNRLPEREVGSDWRDSIASRITPPPPEQVLQPVLRRPLVTTDERTVWERAWSYRDHGKSYEGVYNRPHPPGFSWLHESFGTNWRLTEFQSALGRVLLGKLPRMVEIRRRNAAILAQGSTRQDALRIPRPPSHTGHSYYKYYAFVRPEKLRKEWTRDRIVSAIVAEGIPCFTGSCSEVYLEKAFAPEFRPTKRLTVAKELGETSLMFLVHPTLSEIDMHDTCWAVAKVLDAARSEGHRPLARRGVSRFTRSAKTAGD